MNYIGLVDFGYLDKHVLKNKELFYPKYFD